jgi:ribosomal protein S18 acetylase RimI-like enzyme
MIEYRPIRKEDIPGVMKMCEVEGYTSYCTDGQTAWRALTAPGVCTVVAVDGGQVVGFVQMQSDGLIQAHLSLILVAGDRRRRGIGGRLVREAFARAGGKRMDLAADDAPEFHRSFRHREMAGFRIIP